MNEPVRDPLSESYRRALHEYLDGAGEAALRRAYDLGRRAMGEGTGLLELVVLHHETLLRELLTLAPHQAAERIESAKAFLLESLSPYEIAYRSFREANLALRRLNEVLEEELKRIAHALHDDAAQLLVGVHLALADIARGLPEPLGTRLRGVRELLDQVEAQLRRLSHELRPSLLDDLGLVPALEFFAEGFGRRAGLTIRVHDATHGRVTPAIETALYRIVQEALVNVSKHAHAQSAEVRLEHLGDRLCCSVRDDGRGFDAAAVLDGRARRGLGLLGIRERLGAVGGSLRITSDPEHGTEIHISIPLEGAEAA